MQDPEPYLRALEVEVNCPVNPKRKAIIDSSLRYRINHDLYFFSSRAAMARFKRDPLAYVHIMTDPVTMRRFRTTADSPRFEYGRRSYFFEADSTRVAFQAAPDRFAQRRSDSE